MTAAMRLKQDYLTEADVALLLGIKKSTLAKNRSLGVNHPPFVRITSKIIVYPKREFDRWVESHGIRREIASR